MGCNKLFSERKAILSFNFISMIPRVIFLVIMLIACVVLIRMFLTDKFRTEDIRGEMLVNGLLYGVGGVNYYDTMIGRNYPSIIDLRQMDSSEIDPAFFFPYNNLIAAKIYVSKEPGDEKSALKTIYYNKDWYVGWEPLLVFKDLPGIGGVHEYVKTLPVVYVLESGQLKSGYVTFQIIQPK